MTTKVTKAIDRFQYEIEQRIEDEVYKLITVSPLSEAQIYLLLDRVLTRVRELERVSVK